MPEGLHKADVVEESRKGLHRAIEAEREIRREAAENWRFYRGDQWNPAIKREWESNDRPALTINRIAGMVDISCNGQRETRPTIKFSQTKNTGTDKDTVEIMEGLARQRQQASNAPTAYDTLYKHMAVGGFGAFRFRTEFVDDQTFDQDLFIEPIEDAASVYWDPDAHEYDKSDARRCWILQWYGREAYEEKYGEVEPQMFGRYIFGKKLPGSGVEYGEEWYKHSADEILVCEYWNVECDEETVYLLDNGLTLNHVPKDGETDPDTGEPIVAVMDAAGKPRQRTVERNRRVVQYIHNGLEVKKETVWPGYWIPVFRGAAMEDTFEGKRTIITMVTFQRDPQMILNYLRSKEVEAVAMVPLTPVVGAVGQFKSHAARWQKVNREPVPYLEYDLVKDPATGQPVPAPQRASADVHVEGLLMLSNQVEQDLKLTGGLNDPNLGVPGQVEQSGEMLKRLQGIGDLANFHLIDNLAKTMWHAGRAMAELIPKIYNKPGRMVQILGEDKTEKIVALNQEWKDEQGDIHHYHLGKAEYNCAVNVGPAYATQRQEASKGMADLLRSLPPPLIARVAYLFAQMQDWPMSDELADALMPPDVKAAKDAKEGGGQKIEPGQVQNLLQMVQHLTQMVQQQGQIIQTKQIEAQGREKVAQIQSATQIAKAKLELLKAELSNSQESHREHYRKSIDAIEAELDRAHEMRQAAHTTVLDAAKTAATAPPPEPSPAGATQ